MNELSTEQRVTGEWVTQQGSDGPYRAFLPAALPPMPPLLTAEFEDLQAQANQALGGLDHITRFLPDTHFFLYSYIRKEAILSSQIEGTQCSLSDLLLFENSELPGVPISDVAEVSSYVRALQLGMERIRNGLPITLNLIREIHQNLLSGGRGGNRNPGEFRKVQVRIGGTNEANAAFVPPPAQEIVRLMSDLEKFINDVPARTPTLLKAALAHVQFETIHPFHDGNGRMGRLLISLILTKEAVLHEPLLYLSLYFKSNRDRYYELLQRVRTDGDWEQWYAFFLTGVVTVAQSASSTAHRLLTVFEEDRKTIGTQNRIAGSLIRVHDVLKQRVAVSTNDIIERSGVSRPTAIAALEKMIELGMAREITGKKRNAVYVYARYLDILNEGAEPL
jgi:Fic family protein